MTNPATVDDVQDRMPRTLTAQEMANAEVFLDDAWWLVLDRRPALEADLTAETVKVQNVIRVLAWMVRRILLNPMGWDQESIDDWSGRRSALMASGVLTITDDELADISPGRRRRRSVRLVTTLDDA